MSSRALAAPRAGGACERASGWYGAESRVRRLAHALAMLLMLGCGTSVDAWQWQTTELHYQYGTLAAPTFAGGASSETRIVTLQHASGWVFGDVFAFVDHLKDEERDGFNDGDVYGELYLNLSLAKLSSRRVGVGPVGDVGILLGVNYSHDSKVRKWLPGVRLSWDTETFAFLNTDITAYLDDSRGLSAGGAPAESDSFMVDVNWQYPFEIGGHLFSIEGHGEYIGSRTDELGNRVSDWILLQPQFRYDLGKALVGTPQRLFVGTEWQYWRHKLGDEDTEDNVLQALVVLRL